MTRIRKLMLATTIALAGATSFVGQTTYGQEIGQGMVRSGTVGIENDTERKLFWSLICTCGCPRETLGTCTCGWAHDRREELRAMLKSGMTVEQAQAAYEKRFGSQALAVPPSTGGNRLIYIVPLLAIIAGVAGLITLLRKWSRRGAAASFAAEGAASSSATPATKPSRDEYDEKLDDELKRMDDE